MVKTLNQRYHCQQTFNIVTNIFDERHLLLFWPSSWYFGMSGCWWHYWFLSDWPGELVEASIIYNQCHASRLCFNYETDCRYLTERLKLWCCWEIDAEAVKLNIMPLIMLNGIMYIARDIMKHWAGEWIEVMTLFCR